MWIGIAMEDCEINFQNIIMQRDERFDKDHSVEGQ